MAAVRSAGRIVLTGQIRIVLRLRIVRLAVGGKLMASAAVQLIVAQRCGRRPISGAIRRVLADRNLFFCRRRIGRHVLEALPDSDAAGSDHNHENRNAGVDALEGLFAEIEGSAHGSNPVEMPAHSAAGKNRQVNYQTSPACGRANRPGKPGKRGSIGRRIHRAFRRQPAGGAVIWKGFRSGVRGQGSGGRGQESGVRAQPTGTQAVIRSHQHNVRIDDQANLIHRSSLSLRNPQ
jgi:hypothetical protein